MKTAENTADKQISEKTALLQKPETFLLPLIPTLAAGIVTVIGAAGLLGWTLGVQWLTALRPEFNALRPNAALAAMLCGLSLWLLLPAQPGKFRCWTSRALSLIVCFITLMSLSSFIIDLNLGLDTLLFKYNQWPIPLIGADRYPMRMGLPAALGFFLGALAIFTLSLPTRAKSSLTGYLAFGTGAIGLVGLMGFFYGAPDLHQIATYTFVAAHIAVALVTLCVGILLARPDALPGAALWDKGRIGIVTRRLFLPILIVPLVLGGIFESGFRLNWFNITDGLAILVLLIVLILTLLAIYVISGLVRIEKIEQALRETEQRYSVTLASIGDAVIATDISGRITFMNAVAQKLTGWALADALQKPVKDVFNIINEFSRREVESPVTKALEKGLTSGLANHTLLVRKDGAEVPIDDSGAPIKDKNGNVIGAVLVFRDISLRRQAELEHEYLSSIVKYTDVAIIGKTLDGKITSWNPAAEKLYGYSPAEAIGKPVSIIIPSDKQDEFLNILKNIRAGQRMEYLETTRIRKDGNRIDVSVTISPIKDAGQKVIGASSIARDITERKRTTESLKKMAEELARSNKDLGQFASFAAHDLQAPLRAVTGYLQLLEQKYKDKLDLDAHQFIDYAVNAAIRLKALISNLLTYSKVDAGNSVLAPTDTFQIVQEVLANLKAVVDETHAVVTNDNMPVITADKIQMAQLFQNLIGNALKFHKEQPAVHISAELKNNEWIFSVKDNGIGFEMEYAESIFNSFQRLHSMSEYPGTGLGLSICKKIVERHGGRIWANSIPGEGTTFFFTIPEKKS